MSGPDPNATQAPEAAAAAAARATTATQQPPQHQQLRQPDRYVIHVNHIVHRRRHGLLETRTPLTCGSAPFQSQLEYLSQSQHQQQLPPNVAQYGQHSFDMSSMAGALPGQSPMTSRPYASPDPSQGVSSPNPYQQQPTMYPPTQRGPPRFADPTMMARVQQQFMSAQYGVPSPMGSMPRQQGFPMPQQVPFSPVDPYAFGINPAQYPAMDPRFGPPGSFVLPAGLPADIGIQPLLSIVLTD